MSEPHVGEKMLTTPVFIFSLPRSGSTLLQRCLAAHPLFDTRSEPWFLLELLKVMAPPLGAAVYDEATCKLAVRSFCEGQHGIAPALRAGLQKTATEVYRAAMTKNEACYFIDKTPRYYLIIDEIMEVFPDAKAIFLFRNPLAVAASILDTWGAGRWNLWKYHIDLYEGLERLADGYQRHQSRAIAISYEQMTQDPNTTWQTIAGYLGLEAAPNYLLEGAGNQLSGRYGDKKGCERASLATPEPSGHIASFSGLFRKCWAKKYVRAIGSVARRLGYEEKDLHLEFTPQDLFQASNVPDAARMIYGLADNRFSIRLLRGPASREQGSRVRVRLN